MSYPHTEKVIENLMLSPNAATAAAAITLLRQYQKLAQTMEKQIDEAKLDNRDLLEIIQKSKQEYHENLSNVEKLREINAQLKDQLMRAEALPEIRNKLIQEAQTRKTDAEAEIARLTAKK